MINVQDDPNYIIVLRECDKHETNILFDHTKSLGRRPSLEYRQRSAAIWKQQSRKENKIRGARNNKRMRESLANKGFTDVQIDLVIKMQRRTTRRALLEAGFTQDQVNQILNLSQHPSSTSTNAGTDTDSDDSGASRQASSSWFQWSWSANPDQAHASQDIVSSHLMTHEPTVLIGSPPEATEQDVGETIQPLSRQRVRYWKNRPAAWSFEPKLKRVVHATYGDMLEDGLEKYHYSPGYVTVPQSCASRGDALFYML